MLAWGKLWKKWEKRWVPGTIRMEFSNRENLQVLLSMSARRHFSEERGISARGPEPDGQGQGALEQLHFADLDRGLGICVVPDVTGDFGRVGLKRSLEGFDRLEE